MHLQREEWRDEHLQEGTPVKSVAVVVPSLSRGFHCTALFSVDTGSIMPCTNAVPAVLYLTLQQPLGTKSWSKHRPRLHHENIIEPTKNNFNFNVENPKTQNECVSLAAVNVSCPKRQPKTGKDSPGICMRRCPMSTQKAIQSVLLGASQRRDAAQCYPFFSSPNLWCAFNLPAPALW